MWRSFDIKCRTLNLIKTINACIFLYRKEEFVISAVYCVLHISFTALMVLIGKENDLTLYNANLESHSVWYDTSCTCLVSCFLHMY